MYLAIETLRSMFGWQRPRLCHYSERLAHLGTLEYADSIWMMHIGFTRKIYTALLTRHNVSLAFRAYCG